MKYHGILILLVAMCCMNTPTQMSSQVTGDACSCSTGCDFTQSCTPVGNCVKENVALGRPANMSSSWGEEHPSGPACVAVNGNTGTVYKPLVNGEQNPNCIHTGRDDFNAWWLVKLDRNYTVTNITVYIRSEQPQRMAGVVITVDDQECYKFSSDLQSLPSKTDVSCSPPRKGSVLKFYKNGTQDYLLNFCEVQVWVCRNGSYGFDCNNACGSCRDSLPCNDTNGACLNGCLDGFIGPLCKEICKNGTYGSNCTNKCGQCKNGNNCNASNGVCLNGCEEGYELPLCKEICKNGTYGSNCTNKCGQCKNGNNCNASNGVCLNGCEEGYELPLCKEMCRNGSYGSDCNNTCGSCRDGRPCNASNGVCLDGCLDGFMQPLCKERCNGRFYGSNCTQECGHCNETSMCDFQTGKCLHGCQSGWREPMCSDCKSGFHGTNCNISCGFCKDSQPCLRENGTCADGCADGFKAPDCIEKCPSGSWGGECKNTCGACLEYACRHDNGTCEKGCIVGHEGRKCEVLSQHDLTGPIVGSVLGAGLIISVAVITAVLIWLRRTSMKENQSPEPRSKVAYDASCEMHSIYDLNFQDDVDDKFKTQKDIARPCTVQRKESHDGNDMHPTALENNYEKLAPQYQNSSADSKPYEVLDVSSK